MKKIKLLQNLETQQVHHNFDLISIVLVRSFRDNSVTPKTLNCFVVDEFDVGGCFVDDNHKNNNFSWSNILIKL